jgi:hypothetical protein
MKYLKVDTLELPLVISVSGPFLSIENKDLEPLAWIVNDLVKGDLPDLLVRIKNGESFHNNSLYVSRPSQNQHAQNLRIKWKQLTNAEAGDDVYIVGTTFTQNELLIPRKILQEVIDELIKLREQPLPPSTWLFRPEPYQTTPTNFEMTHIKELEEKANYLDKLDEVDVSIEEMATVSAKRKFLLIELEAAGLLSETGWREKRSWLSVWQLRNLISYFDAALDILAYFRSDERKKLFTDAAIPGSILGGPVCIDWFRCKLGYTPPGYNAYAWLAECECLLSESSNKKGGTGEIRIRENGRWYQMLWRKDDGITPAVLASTPLK